MESRTMRNLIMPAVLPGLAAITASASDTEAARAAVLGVCRLQVPVRKSSGWAACMLYNPNGLPYPSYKLPADKTMVVVNAKLLL